MYTVLFAIRCDDGLSFEPGPASLDGVDAARVAAWLANGWIEGPPVAASAPEPSEDAPLALPHFYGEGEPTPGTWEYEQQHDAAPRRRTRKSEE